ncbi:MAG: hypothetical protein PHS86_09960, partial [Syntrophaceae bacterium]|nr:hypothetical protein [Syntrophaceae bacterium]
YLPLAVGVTPAFILAGYGADHLVRHGVTNRLLALVLIIVPLVLMGIVSINDEAAISICHIASSLFIVAVILVSMFIPKFTITALFLLSIMTVFLYGYPLHLTRPADSINKVSQLSELLKNESGVGRFAKIGADLKGVIPPNQEIIIGLNSPFSYDSLSSLIYQNVVREFSDRGSVVHGRRFDYIESDSRVDTEAFSFTGTNLLISTKPITSCRFSNIGMVDDIMIYRRNSEAIMMAQLTVFHKQDDTCAIHGFLDDQPRLWLREIEAFDDFLSLRTTPYHGETLLFLSRQYHPFWRALSGEIPLKVVTINNFYLGVVIPPGTSAVELKFRPYAIWSWIPQVCFTAITIFGGYMYLKNAYLSKA